MIFPFLTTYYLTASFPLAAIANGDLARLMGAGGGMNNPYSMQGASSLFGNPMLGLTGAAMAAGGSSTGYGLNRGLQVDHLLKLKVFKKYMGDIIELTLSQRIQVTTSRLFSGKADL